MNKRALLFTIGLVLSLLFAFILYFILAFIEIALLAWLISVLFSISFSLISVVKITTLFSVVMTLCMFPKVLIIVSDSANKHYPKE